MLDPHHPSHRLEPPNQHPDFETLRSVLQGYEMDPGTSSWVEAHLEDCLQCQRLAESVEAGELEALVQKSSQEVAPAGIRVTEAYQLLEVAGRGATGTVYRARQTGVDRTIALKQLDLAHSDDLDLPRFRREVEALAQLDHPNIVRVLDTGEQGGIPYLTMEWLDGPTLAEYQHQVTILPKQAAQILLSLSRGMAHAHDKGIIHRDLKPQNVLVVNGQPKIIDFGLARLSENDRYRTRTGAMLGTPCFAAPEQLRGMADEVGPHSDIFSLGAILYQLLTGQLPFDGSSTVEVVQRVLNRDPFPVRHLNRAVPRDLAAICDRCLEKKPARRFASAGELAVELERFLEGRPIQSRRTNAWDRSVRWIGRNPWPFTFGLVTILSLVALLMVQSIHQRTLSAQRDHATENYQAARQTIWNMLDSLQQNSGFDIPKLNQLREQQTREAMKLFEDLALEEQTTDAEIDLAKIQTRWGSIQLGVGNIDAGSRSLSRARDHFLRALQSAPDRGAALRGVLAAEVKIAYALESAGKSTEALRVLGAILPVAENLVTQFPDDPQNACNLAWIHHNLGNTKVGLEQYGQALKHYQRSETTLKAVRDQVDDPTQVLQRQAEAEVGIGLCQMALQDPAADQSYLRAISTMRQVLEQKPKLHETMYAIATAQLNRSNIFSARGDWAQAVEACSDGIRLMQRAIRAVHDQVAYQDTLAMLFANRAMFRFERDAQSTSQQVVDDWRRAADVAATPSIQDYCQIMVTRSLANRNQWAEAGRLQESINPSQLNDHNLYCWVASWAALWNQLEVGDARQQLLATECRRHIESGLQKMAARNLLSDESICQDIRTGEDFRSFREWAGAEGLSRWLEPESSDAELPNRPD